MAYKILITNDDGYYAKGLLTLAKILRQFGSVASVAPKYHQSGMSMAITLGFKPLAYKELEPECGEFLRAYLDATPSSCVKFALDNLLAQDRPAVVVSGINHGTNASMAANYSGTMGAVEEAALNGVLGIGVSLANLSLDADFSAVEEFFPPLFEKLMAKRPEAFGVYYNINFPDLPASRIKGVRVGHQGPCHWAREFQPWNSAWFRERGLSGEQLGQKGEPVPEPGETLYMMAGDFADDTPADDRLADHHIIEDGYIALVPNQLLLTDRSELRRLEELGFNEDF